ncbi:hypothetical protein [Candidatus Poriferisocius sp.]|uniref:hypothetical protein n=1 Tax=Candidatus Poriferisocius sp. TaxID=3101276 RepID=UPI003B0143EC
MRVLIVIGATATDQQPACIQATEDDEAFIVVFVGGMAAETVLCVTEQHERIAYAQSGVLPQSVYDRSGGACSTTRSPPSG